MANQGKVTFKNSAGFKLDARLEMPETSPRAYVLFAHCFTCSKNIQAATFISRSLREEGFAVLRFDFTGLGNSEGDFANTNFKSNIQDLISAARFLEEKYAAPQLLVGHSLGGAAVLSAAAQLGFVRAVVSIAAPNEPEHIKHLFTGKLDDIESQGEAEVSLAGRTFRIKKQFLDDIKDHQLCEQIASFKKALLLFHSPQDEVVSIEHAAKLYKCAKHPKSFVSLDRADHLLSDKDDGYYVGRVIAAWAARYL